MITSLQINTVVSTIAENYKPLQIYVFGSQAQNNTTENSDLDLFIVKNSILPRYKRCTEVWQALRNYKFPFPIDIIVYTPQEINVEKENKYSFVYEVFKTGKIVYEQ